MLIYIVSVLLWGSPGTVLLLYVVLLCWKIFGVA